MKQEVQRSEWKKWVALEWDIGRGWIEEDRNKEVVSVGHRMGV